MRIERDNFFILTGGPGAGKTSVIEALRARGYLCVDEVGRQIIQEQKMIGGAGHHNGDRLLYRELMLSRSILTYQAVAERVAPVFFDRGIPDLIGYGKLIGAETPPHIHAAASMFRSNKKVFIMPPWPEIYGQDDERKQDFAEAYETWRVMAETYPQSGYELIEVPRVSISERADFVLARMRVRE
jgi:predicted ATPase